MIAIHDFIIDAKQAFSETFKTAGGLKLYGDKKFMGDKLSNRIAKVVECPALTNTIIKPDYEVLIDPTIFYSQAYEKTGEQENQYLLDAGNGYYKIHPNMVVCYRTSSESEWVGFEQNVLVEFYREPIEPKTSLILTELKEPEYTKGIAKVTYPNQELIEFGVAVGDTIHIKHNFGVAFYLDGKEFFWIRNRDILAIANKN